MVLFAYTIPSCSHEFLDSLGATALLTLVRSAVPEVTRKKLTMTVLSKMETVEDLVIFLDECVESDICDVTERV